MSIPISQTVPRIDITPNQEAKKNDAVRHHRQAATHLGNNNNGNAPAAQGQDGFWGKDGFTFGDLVDLVNPLQHIPIVSTIYRAITGDEIAMGPRMVGGAVLGGVIGFGLAAANAAVEYETGKDVGETVLAAVTNGASKAMSFAKSSTDSADQVATLQSTSGPSEDMVAMLEAPIVSEAIPERAGKVAASSATSLLDGIKLASANMDQERTRLLLGSSDGAHQQYRQAQMMDMANKTAMKMSI